MPISGQLHIDGAWREGSGVTFSSIDPASGDTVWHGQAANHEDVHEAFSSARRAFAAWSSRPHAEREALLRGYAEQLEGRREMLAETISREIGKPLWESRTEVSSMIGKIELSIRAYTQRSGQHETVVEQNRQVLRHRPHGVVAVFGPYNFPGHLPNGHIVPALLAGNTVVFKPSELAPATAEAMLACWIAAGLPAGVLNLVHGERSTGEAVATHRELDGLFFTGSARTGSLLLQSLGATPGKILALEMGGNNPLLLRPVQQIDAALHDVLVSAFITSGQRCSCARRLLVPDSAWGEQFIARLLRASERLRIAAWNETPPPFMGPLVSARSAMQLLDAEDRLVGLGARILLPMRPLERGPAFLTPGVLDVSGLHVPDEEYFGPLLQVHRYDDLDHAIALANDTRYGLAAGFIGDDAAEYQRFLAAARAGVINWNRPTTGASSAMPFGGIGASGNHRPSAYYAADYCAYPVASSEAATPQLPATLLPGLDLSDTP